MRFKSGIMVGGIKPEMVVALMVIEPILEQYGQECVVTAVRDGKHSKNSKHYLGYAVDLRSWVLSRDNTASNCASAIQTALGGEYFVQAESDHIHAQFNGLPI